MLVSNHLNNNKKTAEELFATTNEQLHQDAKEWLMRTTENCTILSVFIATVSFAAAYTIPGGHNHDTGIPLLRSRPFFAVFFIADVISITLALTSVGIFFAILTSSFPLEKFKTYLFKKLKQGVISLVVSVSMMAVAFGATIVLIMTENVVWDVVAFLPVSIFSLMFTSTFKNPGTLQRSVQNYCCELCLLLLRPLFPRFLRGLVCCLAPLYPPSHCPSSLQRTALDCIKGLEVYNCK